MFLNMTFYSWSLYYHYYIYHCYVNDNNDWKYNINDWNYNINNGKYNINYRKYNINDDDHFYPLFIYNSVFLWSYT